MNDLVVKTLNTFICLLELFDALVGFILFFVFAIIPLSILIVLIIFLSKFMNGIFI